MKKENTGCDFWDCYVIQISKIKGYCNHPKIEEEIRCNYGYTETQPPKECPLKNTLEEKIK